MQLRLRRRRRKHRYPSNSAAAAAPAPPARYGSIEEGAAGVRDLGANVMCGGHVRKAGDCDRQHLKAAERAALARISIMQSISRIAAFAVRRAVFAASRTSASSAAPAVFKAIPRTFAPAAAPVRFFSAGHGG